MKGCCEHGNEHICIQCEYNGNGMRKCKDSNKPSGPIKCEKFVNKLRNYWSLKRDLLHEFILICGSDLVKIDSFSAGQGISNL
jgi:hypothetical protein